MTFLIWTIVAVVFLVAAFALGVKIGRLLKRDDPDDADADSPLPTSHLRPGFVPEQWQPTDEQFRDIPPHSTDL